MPINTEIALNEKDFLLQALHQAIRLDGRSFNEHRDVDLTFGEEYGHTAVALGQTQVSCVISANITTPPTDRQFEGIFNISVEFSPMASPHIESGRPSPGEAILARVLEKTVRRSSALDTESLCLIAGSKCFAIRADIHVIANDGNLTDAASIALVAGLQHFRKPDVTVQGDTTILWGRHEREPVKLSLLHHPYCICLSIYDGGKIVLVDANAVEEEARDGEIIISMNRFGEICQVFKQGGTGVNAQTILLWIRTALKRVQAISELVQSRLSDDEAERSAGSLIKELKADNER